MANDASQVAGWMLEQLDREGMIDEKLLIPEIRERFGEDFLGLEDRNVVISQKVLKEFGRLTQGTLSWDRVHRCWCRCRR